MKPKIPVSTLVDFASGRLSPEEGLKLLDQIEDNPEVSEMLDKAIEFVDIASDPASAGVLEGRRRWYAPLLRKIAQWSRGAVEWMFRSPSRYVGVGAGIAIVVAFAIVAPLPSQGRIAALTIPTDEELHILTRGAEGGEVNLAAHLMANQRFEDAIRVLDWYVAAFPTSDGAARAHLLSGLAHLRRSKETFLGWFVGIDRAEVRNAETQFMSALMLSRSSELSSDAAWYLARAQVLLQSDGNAPMYLDFIEKEGGAHSSQAGRLKELLRERQ